MFDVCDRTTWKSLCPRHGTHFSMVLQVRCVKITTDSIAAGLLCNLVGEEVGKWVGMEIMKNTLSLARLKCERADDRELHWSELVWRL